MATVKEPLAKDFQVGCIEIYTPAGGQITSTRLGGKVLSYAFFQTSIDCNITIVPLVGDGTTTVTIAVRGGIPYPYAALKITAVDNSAVVYILHNGL